jgi:hypothetical protein
MEKKISAWSRMKDAINSFEKNQIFTRQQLISRIVNQDEIVIITDYTLDLYRLALTHIGVLEWIETGKYVKKFDIPENFTTTKLFKLENHLKWKRPDWKDWFIESEDIVKRF